MNARGKIGAKARPLASSLSLAASANLFLALSAASQTAQPPAPTPPPAAEPLLPDWAWMLMLAVVVIGGAIVYLSRTGRPR